MDFKHYQEQRRTLLGEAKDLAKAGDLDKAKAKKAEIEALDREFDEAKDLYHELSDMAEEATPQAPGGMPLGTETLTLKVNVVEATEDERKANILASEDYRQAFFAHLQGRRMTQAQAAAFTQTTADENAPLPTEMQNQIWDLVSAEHPIVEDVQVIRSNKAFSIPIHKGIEQGAAKEVDEAKANDDEKNTWDHVDLNGKDFSKHIEVSYAMMTMAIPALQDYLVNELANNLSEPIATHIVAAIRAKVDAGNKQTPEKLDWDSLCDAFGLLEHVRGVKFYANRKTFYGTLVKMRGEDGQLVFQQNAQEGAENAILGAQVRVEPALEDDLVLIGDPQRVVMALITPLMIETDKDIKRHVHILSAYERAEAALVDAKSFAEVKVTPL